MEEEEELEMVVEDGMAEEAMSPMDSQLPPSHSHQELVLDESETGREAQLVGELSSRLRGRSGALLFAESLPALRSLVFADSPHPDRDIRTALDDLDHAAAADARVLAQTLDPHLGLDVPIRKVAQALALNWPQRLISHAFPSFQAFKDKVRSLDSREKCGLVWASNSLAYRCRTCAISPCMSICTDCFRAGDHAGHDFNMFKSQAGGACDCGDAEVMRPAGFCAHHGKKDAAVPKAQPNPTLMAATQYVLAKLLARALHHIRLKTRRQEGGGDEHYKEVLRAVKPLLSLVREVTELGAEAHACLFDLLRDPLLYVAISGQNGKGQAAYASAVLHLPPLPSAEEAAALDCVAVNAPLKHHHLLDELFFWTVAMDFPDDLVFLILSLLPLDDYRECLNRSFAEHYTRIGWVVSQQRRDEDLLSSRVVHISVQLLSSEENTARLVQHHGLLTHLVASLHAMLKVNHFLSPLHVQAFKEEVQKGRMKRDMHLGSHETLDCESSALLRSHSYYALVSDLHNLLSHPSAALHFARDPHLLDVWAAILLMLQGMNPVKRLLDAHVEFESRAFSPAFTAEIEVSGASLTALLGALESEGAADWALLIQQRVRQYLETWFTRIRLTGPKAWGLPPLELLWHLPLHRWLGAALLRSVLTQPAPPWPPRQFLRQLALHPLQLQVGRAEVALGLWVRNGVEPRHQAIIYAQSHFTKYFADPDLALLQLVSSRVDAEWVVLTVLERFHLVRWLSFSPGRHQRAYLRPEWEQGMLEAGLRCLASLAGLRHLLGQSEEKVAELELSAVLAANDASHSALMDAIPRDRESPHSSFDPAHLLPKLADYVEAAAEEWGSVGPSQGTYRPSAEMWENVFDPLFASYRATNPNTYYNSLHRFNHYARKSGRVGAKEEAWPPFRVPSSSGLHPALEPLVQLTRSKALLAVIYTCLFRAAQGGETVVSDAVVQLCLHLLEMSLSWTEVGGGEEQSPRDGSGDGVESEQGCCGQGAVLDLHLLIWFPGPDLHKNLAHRIHRVLAFDSIPSQCKTFPCEGLDCPEMPELRRLNAADDGASNPSTSTTVARKAGIPYIDSMDAVPSSPPLSSSRRFWDSYWAALPAPIRRLYLTHIYKPPLTLSGEDRRDRRRDEYQPESTSTALALVDDPVPIVEVSSEESEGELSRSPSCSALRVRSYSADSADLLADDPRRPIDWSSDPPPLGHPAAPKALPSPAFYATEFRRHSILSLLVRLYPKYTTDGATFKPTPSQSYISLTFRSSTWLKNRWVLPGTRIELGTGPCSSGGY